MGNTELVAVSDRKRLNLVGLSRNSPRLIKVMGSRVRLSTEPRPYARGNKTARCRA
ncbi:Sodium channel protein type 11 subunit alpha (Sodium channel protein type XI subunit alpha) (Voltage-gated sodium channel subunit alpha Nav1.9) (Sensory neuron sodium channel 2) (NaN) (fragment) [Candidatus Methylomirabilis oxygeniifera]|uniref:Sodium channel protein type 11 subunit alpha (Sodium channel protein type XI subunit alpha) (Voltage-gated sodium channel subunit alpha Nav1.9) (Sensory neuron sodium channel 2) (NaN) n=1 Tax=Methylomirabilis oxygeniifera TaxID=671143 RepID=D5MJQ9_METO1